MSPSLLGKCTHIYTDSHTDTQTHTHTKVTKALSLSEQRRNQISKYFLFDQISSSLFLFLLLSLLFPGREGTLGSLLHWSQKF